MFKILEAYLRPDSFLVHFYQKMNSFDVFSKKFWMQIQISYILEHFVLAAFQKFIGFGFLENFAQISDIYLF